MGDMAFHILPVIAHWCEQISVHVNRQIGVAEVKPTRPEADRSIFFNCHLRHYYALLFFTGHLYLQIFAVRANAMHQSSAVSCQGQIAV